MMEDRDMMEQVPGATIDQPVPQADVSVSQAIVAPQSRRTLLKSAIAGAGGLALVGFAGGGQALAHPFKASSGDTITSIFSVAATAEELAVTFYSQGIANAAKLGISGSNLTYLKAARAEEQNHKEFLVANGGSPLTSTFSFPSGAATFTHLNLFINTLEQLEVDFIAAYLAAVKELASMEQPRLAQIAAQIMGIECEHRTLGRDIGGLTPADNFAYEPVVLATVGDAVAALKDQGYLSPKSGNSFEYHPVSDRFPGVIHLQP